MSRVVVAPDSFKGSITADSAADAIATGWRSVRPGDDVLVRPMADGGEGTLDAVARSVPGAVRHPVVVHGPDGRAHDAAWLRLPDGRGVVELAATSGLGLLASAGPFDAHTRGFGEAVAAALDAGVTGLLLAIGGSASTDGGAGMLGALGARLLDSRGARIPLGNRGLAVLATADLTALRPLPPGGAVVLSDVGSPLTGPHGAAVVFGPQKGARERDLAAMDANLARLAAVLGGDPSIPGAGAAGGTGYALSIWGAGIAPGARAIAELVGLPAALADADLLVTGEGRFDSTSSRGKVVGSLLHLGRSRGVPVALVAGSIAAGTRSFAARVALAELAGSVDAALTDPRTLLERAGAVLAGSARAWESPHRPRAASP